MYKLPQGLANNLKDFRKFQENPWQVWNWCQAPGGQLKAKFERKLREKKSAAKHSKVIPILLNYVNLFVIFILFMIATWKWIYVWKNMIKLKKQHHHHQKKQADK